MSRVLLAILVTLTGAFILAIIVPSYNDYVMRGEPARHRNEVVALYGTVTPHGIPSLMCSGVVIDKDTILTAAHCVCGRQVSEVRFGYQVDQTGAGDYESIPVQPSKTVSLTSCEKNFSDGDLATIKVKYPPHQTRLKVAQLASPADIERLSVGGRIVVVGYAPSNGVSGRRTMGFASIVDARCDDPDQYGCGPKREFVTSPANSGLGIVGTCPGDSGGPAILLPQGAGPSSPGVVVGIDSRSPKNAGPCGDGSVYVLLSGSQRTWVLAQLNARSERRL